MVPDKKQDYINTPFSFIKNQKGLSLLQQDVLNRVSSFLQDYISQYFGSDLKNSTKRPKPLFDEAVKNNGLPEFVMSYDELMISDNNITHVKNSVEEVLNLKIPHPGIDEKTGSPAMIWDVIFIRSTAPIPKSGNGQVRFRLNPLVVDYVFDMSQGYVKHPIDIARITYQQHMPMTYFIFRHCSLNYRLSKIELTVMEFKEYLGMVKRSTDTNEIVKIAYPKYSQFRQNCIIPIMEETMRLFSQGKIDAIFRYQAKYSTRNVKGDPKAIVFHILQGQEAHNYIAQYQKDKLEDPKKLRADEVLIDLNADESMPPKKRGRKPRRNLDIEIPFEEEPFDRVEAANKIIEALKYNFGTGAMGFDYYFGKRAECRIDDDTVSIKVPKSIASSVRNGVNIMDTIKKSVYSVMNKKMIIKIV